MLPELSAQTADGHGVSHGFGENQLLCLVDGRWSKLCCFSWMISFHMAMDQYLLIAFLVGWTSIYQLFWCSPGVQGFDTLPNVQMGTVSHHFQYPFLIWLHFSDVSFAKKNGHVLKCRDAAAIGSALPKKTYNKMMDSAAVPQFCDVPGDMPHPYPFHEDIGLPGEISEMIP